jgi:hypothetical protein
MPESDRDSQTVANPAPQQVTRDYVRFHLCFGWWQLLVFLTLGIALEVMHGIKSGWYLDVDNETRRLMLTLAHTHGTLLALVNIAFSWTVIRLPEWKQSHLKIASWCLLAASLLMPLGFLLGGLFPYSGDPSLGILLLPAAAVFLLVAVLLTAIASGRR